MTEHAITTQTAGQRRHAADAVDHVADDEHERVHAEHVRADDREHVWPAWCWWSTTIDAGQRHHPDHHREARLRGEQRRDHARPAQRARAAARRAGRRPRAGRGLRRGEQLGDPARVGPHGDARAPARRRMKPPAADHSIARPSPSSVVARRQRAEHGRPEDRPEDGAEQHQRDAVRPALGRVHVARRGPREQRRAARRAHRRAGRAARAAGESTRRSRAPPARSRSRRPRSRPRAPARGRSGPSRAPPAARPARPTASTIAGPSPSSPSTPTTRTSVSDATAAESCSIAELAASAADEQQRVAPDRQRARGGAQTTTFHGWTRHAVTSSAAT